MDPRQESHSADSSRSRNSGFTLVELLVVIAIIGILVALMLPAVAAVREAARRSQCSNNLVQLILAVNQYEMFHSVYPPGTIEARGPIQNVAKGYHHSWITQILPYIEQRNTNLQIDYSVGVYHPKNATVRDMRISTLACSSSQTIVDGYSSYAGVHHDIEAPIDVNNNGIFFLNSCVRNDEVLDGTSQTLFIGEKMIPSGDLGWMSGTNATLRNTGSPGAAGRFGAGFLGPNGPPSKATNDELGSFGMDIGLSMPAGIAAAAGESPALPVADGPPDTVAQSTPPVTEAPPTTESTVSPPVDAGQKMKPAAVEQAPSASLLFVGGFSSFHPGGFNVALGDGSVTFISTTMNAAAYQQLGHRADGKLLSGESF